MWCLLAFCHCICIFELKFLIAYVNLKINPCLSCVRKWNQFLKWNFVSLPWWCYTDAHVNVITCGALFLTFALKPPGFSATQNLSWLVYGGFLSLGVLIQILNWLFLTIQCYACVRNFVDATDSWPFWHWQTISLLQVYDLWWPFCQSWFILMELSS